MSTCLAQITIFSLANGGSDTKSFPFSSSEAGIMNAKGFLPISILRVEVEVAIVEF